jgi:hypothetical protein
MSPNQDTCVAQKNRTPSPRTHTATLPRSSNPTIMIQGHLCAGATNYDVVAKACNFHKVSKKELEAHKDRFCVFPFLKRAGKDPKSGKMEVELLSPCQFTRDFGQYSQVLDPAKSAFQAYEKTHHRPEQDIRPHLPAQVCLIQPGRP